MAEYRGQQRFGRSAVREILEESRVRHRSGSYRNQAASAMPMAH